MTWQVTNKIGTRLFKKEEDAYDWAIKVMSQMGLKSDIQLVSDLHPNQRIIYDYIRKHGEVKKTLREFADLVGMTSAGHVNHHIFQLQKRGLIEKVGRSTYKYKESA